MNRKVHWITLSRGRSSMAFGEVHPAWRTGFHEVKGVGCLAITGEDCDSASLGGSSAENAVPGVLAVVERAIIGAEARNHWRVTRIDLAMDVAGSPVEHWEQLRLSERTEFKKRHHLDVTGAYVETIDCGSRDRMFLRVYDKEVEQENFDKRGTLTRIEVQLGVRYLPERCTVKEALEMAYAAHDNVIAGAGNAMRRLESKFRSPPMRKEARRRAFAEALKHAEGRDEINFLLDVLAKLREHNPPD